MGKFDILQKRLDSLLTMLKTLGPNDLEKAYTIWNSFEPQFQSVFKCNENAMLSNKGERSSPPNIKINSKVKFKGTSTTTTDKDEHRPVEISDSKDQDIEKDGRETIFAMSMEGAEAELDKSVVDNSDKQGQSQSTDKDIEEPKKVPKRKRFVCSDCGSMFSTKGNYTVHLRKHSGNKPFGCTKCSKQFHTSSNLRRHLLSHQGVKPYPCTVCDARFTEKKSLIVHIRKHSGERPYVCKVCRQRYSSRTVLSQHLKTHEGEQGKGYKCNQCSKAFTQKSQLKVHEQRHAGVKPHVCSYCDMPFTTRSDLRRHEKTHSGVGKTYVCDKCGKSFARSQTLKCHLNKHEERSERESKTKV